MIREKREKKLRRRVWLAGKQRGLGRRETVPLRDLPQSGELCRVKRGGRVSENQETR